MSLYQRSLQSVQFSALTLGAFGLIASALLVFTFQFTKERIEFNQRQAFLQKVQSMLQQH